MSRNPEEKQKMHSRFTITTKWRTSFPDEVCGCLRRACKKTSKGRSELYMS